MDSYPFFSTENILFGQGIKQLFGLLQSDQILFYVVGVFVVLLGGIIVINLVPNKLKRSIKGKIDEQTYQTETGSDKKENIQSEKLDDEWKGI